MISSELRLNTFDLCWLNSEDATNALHILSADRKARRADRNSAILLLPGVGDPSTGESNIGVLMASVTPRGIQEYKYFHTDFGSHGLRAGKAICCGIILVS
jgi:hypothetical protein